MSAGLRYDLRDDGIAVLTLDRPDKRNAVMPDDWRALEDRLDEGAADARVRVFVLTGAGGLFSAGGDLKTMGERLEQSPVRRSREMLRMTRAIQRFRDTPKPIIAAVPGPAIGAGLVLALACDLRVAAESARFSAPFLRVGMQPDFGGAYFLPRLVGTARAMGLALLGDKLPAQQAADWGLIWKCVDDADLAPTVEGLLAQLAQGPTRGLVATRRALHAGYAATLETQLDLERDLQRELGYSADYREGVAAFLAKRPPRFTGK